MQLKTLQFKNKSINLELGLPLLIGTSAGGRSSKLPLLGAISWLMMQQTATRHTLLSELEWRVMPALVLDQTKLYMRDDSPIAYVSWATLSETVAQRYAAAPHQLAAPDWKSGEQVWIVDLLVPFGGAQEVMNDLRAMSLRDAPSISCTWEQTATSSQLPGQPNPAEYHRLSALHQAR